MRLHLLFLLALAACGAPEDGIAIRGDSTALASGEGLRKVFNYAPSLDSERWWNCVRGDRPAFNDGVGGQSIATMRDKMLADTEHRDWPTIIYDRHNGETPEEYITALSVAVGTLTTDRLLILPQVARTDGLEKPEDKVMTEAIDAEVLRRWPRNTFDPQIRAAFAEALSSPDTRQDGLHRNAKGNWIECRFIKEWTDANWR